MQINVDDFEAYIITRELKNGIKWLKEQANESRFLNKHDDAMHAIHLIGKYKELIKRIEQEDDEK